MNVPKCRLIIYWVLLLIIQIAFLLNGTSVFPSTHSTVFIHFDTIDWRNEEETIFFIAACDGNETYPGIELCAFESASKHNPEKKVIVVLNEDVTGCNPPEYFGHLKNIQFVKANFTHIFDGTPVEQLWESGIVHESQFKYVHTSDLLRLTLVFKFGGSYYDSDIISLKSTPKTANFVLLEDDNYLSASLIKYQRNHQFLNDCLIAIANDYQGHSYLNQGPYVVTRIGTKYCKQMRMNTQEECEQDMSLLPISSVSAISYPSWQIFYDPARYEDILNALKDSFAFHYWRRMKTFQSMEYNIDPEHPLYRLAETHCPLTTENVLRNSFGRPYGRRN